MAEDFPIGLQEAIQIVKDCEEDNLESLLENEQLVGFFNSINKCGTEALRVLSDEQALSAVEFIQISTVLQLLSQYEWNPLSVIEILSLAESKVFQNAVTLAFKSGIGMYVTEELR